MPFYVMLDLIFAKKEGNQMWFPFLSSKKLSLLFNKKF